MWITKTIVGHDGTPLSGDMAARILDVAGIVLNRNTIPGDKTALFASGIRYGTPWMTQRGLKEAEMIQVADAMADILQATKPYSIETRQGPAARAKIDFDVLEDVKLRVRSLAEKAGADVEVGKHAYPHFFFIDDKPADQNGWVAFDLSGDDVLGFVNYVFASDGEALKPGESQNTRLNTPKGSVDGILTWVKLDTYRFSLPAEHAGLAGTWLRDLSDGYVGFDVDVTRRLPGPIYVIESAEPVTMSSGERYAKANPFHIGMDGSQGGDPKPSFTWEEKEPETLRVLSLCKVHKAMGAKSSRLLDGKCLFGTHLSPRSTWRPGRQLACLTLPTWAYTRRKVRMQPPSSTVSVQMISMPWMSEKILLYTLP